MSNTASILKSETKALDGRRKVVLFYTLCKLADIDIEEELSMVLHLVSDKIGTSECFKVTDSEVLNQYKIWEYVPYQRINKTVDGFKTIFNPSEEEIENRMRTTYVIQSGHSLLGDIELLLDELSKYAAKKNRDRFTRIKQQIAEKAPEAAKEVVPESAECATTIAPESTNHNTESKPKHKKVEERRPHGGGLEFAAKLSAEKKLPLFINQRVTSKKIKKGIYYKCVLDIRGNHKVSKNAYFVNCQLI